MEESPAKGKMGAGPNGVDLKSAVQEGFSECGYICVNVGSHVKTTDKLGEHPRERVVFANGIFDLLHPGHIELLRFAKALGGKLVVGINSDRATKLLKGPERPIYDEHHRKAMLESLGFVDEVVIFDDTKTLDTILKVNAHVVVKGDEWTVEEIRRKDKIPPFVDIRTFPLVKDDAGVKLSTSSAVQKLKRD